MDCGWSSCPADHGYVSPLQCISPAATPPCCCVVNLAAALPVSDYHSPFSSQGSVNRRKRKKTSNNQGLATSLHFPFRTLLCTTNNYLHIRSAAQQQLTALLQAVRKAVSPCHLMPLSRSPNETAEFPFQKLRSPFSLALTSTHCPSAL